MLDQYGRSIHYMRLSITDSCNLRCRYCMPANGAVQADQANILSLDALLQIVSAAVSLGITRFKITGGEPLVRKGCVDLIQEMKKLPGVEQVTITTNGILLAQYLPDLIHAGIDGVNISLDTLDPQQYQSITRSDYSVDCLVAAVRDCASVVPTRINAVLLKETSDQIIPLASLSREMPVDVRFIETMPIGEAAREEISCISVLDVLKQQWPDLTYTPEHRGNGPARYYQSAHLQGRIGLIEAISQSFCSQCNRVRITSRGTLIPCLYHTHGINLTEPIRKGTGEDLLNVMESAIYYKPASHSFVAGNHVPGHRGMHGIGG